MNRPYATSEGIREYLSTIAGLHALREDRKKAADRHERARSYCILGRFLLTEDGRFGELSGLAAEIGDAGPDVIETSVLERVGRAAHGDKWRMRYRTPASLAPHDRSCSDCGETWTLANCHDVVVTREARVAWLDDFIGCTYHDVQREFWQNRRNRYWMTRPAEGPIRESIVRERETATFLVESSFHGRCHRAMIDRDTLWWAEDALERAGYADATPESCRAPADGFDPWFRLATKRGEIRFGRRSPGFGIDWSMTDADLTERFCRIDYVSRLGPIWNEPPVDNGPFHVDPKDEAYLVLYLERLRQALGL